MNGSRRAKQILPDQSASAETSQHASSSVFKSFDGGTTKLRASNLISIISKFVHNQRRMMMLNPAYVSVWSSS
jgi:hypothetical protein